VAAHAHLPWQGLSLLTRVPPPPQPEPLWPNPLKAFHVNLSHRGLNHLRHSTSTPGSCPRRPPKGAHTNQPYTTSTHSQYDRVRETTQTPSETQCYVVPLDPSERSTWTTWYYLLLPSKVSGFTHFVIMSTTHEVDDGPAHRCADPADHHYRAVRPDGRGLHSLTSELNLRTFGTHRSPESST
jgi:hypothetical protein